MKQKNTLRFRLLLFAAILCGTTSLMAQTTVSGTLTDQESGEPLIGASILAVGTSTGTITDFDGNYSLQVPEGVNQLQFSYTGYPTLVEDINGRSTIDLAFQAGELLEEVVVVGYGSVKKDDLTGSVNTIDEETFNKGAIVNPTNLISGKIAGVQVQSGDGQPGGGTSIRIRGGTSITASNEPLYVVDGVPLPYSPDGDRTPGTRNPLNFLNPNDIATMTVLKDASAAAIYGSRGANGVVIITTKKGKKGQARINYDGSFTTSSVAGDQPILGREDFINVVTFAAPERLDRLGNADTDWFDLISRTAYGTRHNLAISGGGETNTYRASVGYQQLDGVLLGSSTERIGLAVNFTQQLFNNNLTVAANVKGANTSDTFDPGVVGTARYFDPTQPVLDPDNTRFGGYFEYNQALAPRNPVSSIEQITNTGETYRGIGNLDIKYDFKDLIPGLSYQAILGFDVESGVQNRFLPTTYQNTVVASFEGEFNINNGQRTSKLFDTYFTYEREFGSQRASLQLGYSYQDFNSEFPSIQGLGLDTDAFGTNNPSVAEEIRAFNRVLENRLISFFGRLNYNINEKYLLTASLRRDGSSRFGPSNRWGMFPSAAFAWRILQEDFAAGLSNVFSDLKLRIGYGVTGNQDFGDYLYLPVYQFGDQRAQYQFGDRYIPTIRPNAYDADLKWEETSSLNIGLDFGFLNNRLNGIIEYYQKNTNDLLFSVNVPAGTNLSDRVLTNIGEVQNNGVELTLNGIVFAKDDIALDITGNLSYNNNEVKRLDGSGSADIAAGFISGGVGNTVQLQRVGQPVNSFYLYEQLYQDDGRPRRDGVDYNDDGVINLADMYADTNGDGVVNDQDLRIIEQPAPRMLFGLTSNLNYGKLDFSMTFRGTLGNYNYNNNASSTGYFRALTQGGQFLNNINPTAVYTRFEGPQFFSDYYLEDASFLRLDNVSLGYNFGRLGTNGPDLRVYATGQNLFVLTNYSGVDPEVGMGIDQSPYPRSRIFTLGISAGL